MTALSIGTPGAAAQPLLHAPEGALAGTNAPNRFGLWPMVPFANRAFTPPDGAAADAIAGPSLLLPDGSRLALTDPSPGETGAIHGSGWRNDWTVEAAEPRAVLLSLSRPDESVPFRARVRYALLEADGGPALEASLSVENVGSRALPFGIGFHPWFPRGRAASVALRARAALRLGPGYRPLGTAPAPEGLDGSPLPPGEVAVALVDWDGRARLEGPDGALTVEASETLRQAVLWSPEGAGFVCFEPQSHALGAASEAAAQAAPLTVLVPGGRLEGTMRLAPG